MLQDGQAIVEYYGVLNRLCALGSVEKMYIPPVLDIDKSVYENQMHFERQLADGLSIGPGRVALELGCGCARDSSCQ